MPGFSGCDKLTFSFRAVFTFQGVRRSAIRTFSYGACIQHVLVGHYCQWDLSKCSKDCAESGTKQYL